MRRSGLLLLSSAFIVSGTALILSADAARQAALPVVPTVDLKRYAGVWYEIARLPNRFQRKCQGNVTARYTLFPDGKIEVLNSCDKTDGGSTETKGSARLADKNGAAAKLKVTFFWPFSGDYWILDLDSGYRRALVGTPNREYLWILSRTPRLAHAEYEHLLERAKTLGFDVAKVQETRQSWPARP